MQPRRTIRAVLYMNEEFGATAGAGYAAAARRAGERHIAAMESDRGAGTPPSDSPSAGDASPRSLEALAARSFGRPESSGSVREEEGGPSGLSPPPGRS